MLRNCSQELPPPAALIKQTAATLLRSCSGSGSLTQLKQIHSVLLTTGLSVKNSLLTDLLVSLIDLGHFHYARMLFDGMHKPRVFLWNTLIRGYSKNGMPFESVSLFKQMVAHGVRPDEFTHPFVIKACSGLPELWVGAAVHAHVSKHGLEFSTHVRNELMIMYARFGDISSADYFFGSMIERDLVAWNAYIAACVQVGNATRALALFHEMRPSGIRPDAVTVACVLSACGQLGCLETGENFYEYALSKGILSGNSNVIVENARLDMYMKCGSTDNARSLFNQMPHRSVVTWSTMIMGYAINGDSKEALTLLQKMQNSGPHPNHVTYLGALLACVHTGLVEKGRALFNMMAGSRNTDIQPRKEHYACMVDLLGRSGKLQEAYEFIMSMPIEPDAGVWGALLSACSIHKNVKLGQVAADKLLLSSPDVASYQVLLSNMYASVGNWKSVSRLRLQIRKKGIKKVTGCSTVELHGEIHVFSQGDWSHPQAGDIYQKLEELYAKIKDFGYIQEVGSVYHDLETEEKESMISVHCEKLAVAFALVVNEAPGSPIYVIKNLRTCEDCHNFCKFVSKVTSRKIVMRDKSRFHHFWNGTCSCKDFW